MIEGFKRRRFFIIFGVVFGAWLGGMYAFWSQAVNWIALPGIPLTPLGNNLNQYLFQHILIGALLGFVTSLPAASAAGISLGGLLGAVAVTGLAVRNEWGSETLLRTVILLLYTFLPLVVLFMPIAFLVRRGTDAQEVDPDRPYLWARRYVIPLLLTFLILLIASFSLYTDDARNAFRYMRTMLENSQPAQTIEALPRSLQLVQGYLENAKGPYSLGWSDKVETFMGPVPATGGLSQFLIIATYENGFQFACVFSRTTTVPNCTNY